MYPPSCFSVQPYIGRHYRASLIDFPGLPSLTSGASSTTCDGDSNMAVTLQWTPPTNTGGQGVMITYFVLTGLPQSASCSTGPCDNITSTTYYHHWSTV